MKKRLSTLLILSLLLPVLLVPASGSAQKLNEGIAPTDCLALAAQCAIADGHELDPGSVGRDGDLIFCKVGIFTLSVESRNGTAIVCVDGSYDYDVSWDGFSYGVRPCVRVSVGALGK